MDTIGCSGTCEGLCLDGDNLVVKLLESVVSELACSIQAVVNLLNLAGRGNVAST